MKATIMRGKVTHNFKRSPLNPEYWRSDCGMVYSEKLLTPQNGTIQRVCLQCNKHELKSLKKNEGHAK